MGSSGALPSQPYVDIREWGAKASTSASPFDCASAIQAALNQGGVAPLIVPDPAGVYFFSTTLSPPAGSMLYGIGCGGPGVIPANNERSCLKRITGSTGPAIDMPAGIDQCTLVGFEIDCNSAGTVGINVDDVGTAEECESLFQDLYVHDAPGDGIYIGAGRRAAKLQWVKIRNSGGTAGLHIAGSDAEVLACLLAGQTGATTNNMQIESTAGIARILGGDFYGAYYGIYINGGDGRIAIGHVGLDKHNRSGIYIASGTKSVSVADCLFHSNSQASDGGFPHVDLESTDGTFAFDNNEFGDLDSGITNRCNYDIFAAAGAAFTEGTYTSKVAALSTGQHTNRLWQISGAWGGIPNDDNTSVEPLSILMIPNTTITPANQTALFTFGVANRNVLVSNIVTATRGTAATSLTYAAVALYTVDDSGNLTQRAISADVHTTIWASTNTEYVTPMGTPYQLVAGQRFALALLAVGTGTFPALMGISYGVPAALNDSITRGQSVGAQGSLQASYTAASMTNASVIPWMKGR